MTAALINIESPSLVRTWKRQPSVRGGHFSRESTEKHLLLCLPWERVPLFSSVASYRGLVLTFLRMLAPSFLADMESLWGTGLSDMSGHPAQGPLPLSSFLGTRQYTFSHDTIGFVTHNTVGLGHLNAAAFPAPFPVTLTWEGAMTILRLRHGQIARLAATHAQW